MDAVELEVLWGSLINTVNEQARALQRAAFSPIVREAGDLANALFGPTEKLDGGIVGVGSFLAVIAGGFVAARLAGRWGLYQGTVVGIGFIVVSVAVQFGQEASIVHQSLSSGAHHIVDLGPMRMDNVISGDLLALFGGSFGGWMARRK